MMGQGVRVMYLLIRKTALSGFPGGEGSCNKLGFFPDNKKEKAAGIVSMPGEPPL
jgi:hypothetical protein